MIYYRQCTFQCGNTVQTAWIEERGAKVGSKITLKTDGEDPSKFWTVLQVGSERMPEKRAKEFERAYTKHREFSDI